ncbi:YuzB family protein [Niallia sp. 03133]|uniref:YuzB family protein n=1 Tax=Niallia sp. 03133 TaxID=3458060 RepID=UPI004044B77A
MLKPIIEFCLSNLSSGSQEAKEILEQDEDLDVLDYGCLGLCGQCGESLYALVNGEVVTAETSEQLVANVYLFLEENPML